MYEFFNRQAAEQAANRLFSRTADGIGHRVASDTVSLVAGDKRFIDEILNQEDREVLLKKIILAHLNQDAEELAASTAAQLSGQPILSGYRATYFARDKLNPPHALFEQSLTRHSAPNELFEFVFQVFRSEDTDKFTYGPEVFTWRYWLAPDEDPKTVLKAFVVESVAVNGVPLEDIKLDETHVSSDSVRWTGRYSPQSGKRFLVETKIRLPAPKEASYVHVEPRALSQGFEVSCDVTDSKLDAVAVETVRTRNIRISKSPADLDSGTRRTTQSRTVYTAEWVLPSAAVAYVFYTPTEPYNKPTTTHEAN
ncbi:MAG TPA: hypothetical protein VEW93_06980 [Acidimicrobiales bacterium]|nr:hypothetical protein [Acidimicrobiales bacterium]